MVAVQRTTILTIDCLGLLTASSSFRSEQEESSFLNMAGVDPAAAAAALAGGAHSFLDARMMGKPATWNGDKVKWAHWQLSMQGYCGALSPELLVMMKVASGMKEPISWTKHNLSQRQKDLDAAFFYVLTNTTCDKAADVLLNVEEGHGCEAWRRFSRAN